MPQPDTPPIKGIDLDGLRDSLADADIVFADFGLHARKQEEAFIDHLARGDI